MPITRLLIANRGEIAIRIGRAAADLGLRSVAVHSRDDARSLHVRATDEVRELPGQGAAAYLDADAVIAAAKASGCDAVHPGYGFLSERADFARRCAKAGLIFVGPTPGHLELFGDKARARTAAVAADVPVIHGMDRAVSLQEAQAFFASLRGGAMIIKAVAGGGGRGTRAVFSEAEIDPAYQRCRSEAEAAFGCGDVYVEQYIPRARHIEVQILGDLSGTVTHLGERECSIQRRFQKIIEVAPAPALDDELRYRIIEAAVRFAKSVGYTNLGTFEFLVDVTGQADAQPFVFIETNARLQVEHTVTEEVTGVDLVQAQILLAQGSTLNELGLGREPTLRGYAIQARVNMETVERRRQHPPRRRHACRVRGAEWTRRADRWVRLCGLPHVGRIRLASGEGDRAFAPAGFRGLGDARRSCAERIPDRRRRYQHPVSAQHPGPPGFHFRPGSHALGG